MSRRGENLHKRKDGRWEGRYKSGIKPDGTARYTSVYAPTYTACKQKLEKAKQAAEDPTTAAPPNLLFSAVLHRWLYANRVRLKGATEAKYLTVMETHILPVLGGLRAARVDAATVNRFLEQKRRCGGLRNGDPLSPAYVRTMAIILQAALNYAVREGLIPPQRSPINKPPLAAKELSVLSPAEEEALTRILRTENSPVAAGTLLALQAGLRIGEVCALRWSDIDFEQGIIHVRHTVSRVLSDTQGCKTALILDAPKTPASRRDIPLSAPLQAALCRAPRRDTAPFVATERTAFVGTRTFDYQYRRLLAQNGFRPVNFHTLRHTFATRLAAAGVDAKTLSCLLGHASSATTLNVYVHPSLDGMKSQLDRIYCSA